MELEKGQKISLKKLRNNRWRGNSFFAEMRVFVKEGKLMLYDEGKQEIYRIYDWKKQEIYRIFSS